MTDLLPQLLRERAESVELPDIGAAPLIAEASRRVRRRRLAVAGGAATLALAAGWGMTLLPHADRAATDLLAAGLEAHSPSWSEGRTVHVGEASFTVEQPIVAYVQTDVGVVYVDQDDAVRASDGRREAVIGHVSQDRRVYDEQLLVADGRFVAWVDEGDDGPRFARFDQSTGETAYAPAQLPPRDTQADHLAQVSALDAAAPGGPVVWAVDGRGVVSWTPDGVVVEVAHDAQPWIVVRDARAGVVAYLTIDPRTDTEELFVGRRIGDGQFIGAGSGLVVLSPDGQQVVTDIDEGSPLVYDVSTGRVSEAPELGGLYVTPLSWAVGDRFVGLGLRDTATDNHGDPTRFDIVTCSLKGSGCDVVTSDLELDGSSASVPLGVHIG